MSYKTCPEWPELMELAPDLQFKHISVADAQLPFDVLVEDLARLARRGRDVLRPRSPRVQRRPHRRRGRGSARRHALVRGARVGHLGARRLEPRGLTRRPARSSRLAGAGLDAHACVGSGRGHGRRPLPLRRQEPAPRRRSRRGRARDARRRARGSRRARPTACGSSPTTPPPRAIAVALGVEVVADPGGGQGAAVQAALAGVDGVCLVVNADLPRVRPSDLDALARPAARGRGRDRRRPRDGTTNALGLPFAEAFAPLYGPGSAARFRAHAAARSALDGPDLETTSTSVADLERSSRAGPRTAALACSRGVNVVLLSGGVGGAKLAAGLHDVLAPGRADGRRQRRRRPRGARPARLARPRLGALRPRRSRTTRSAAGAGPARPGRRSSRRARWGGEDWFMLGDLDLGLHLVRSQALRGGEPLSAVTAAARPRGGPRAPASCPRRTTGSAPTSSPRRARSPSRSGSSPAATRTRSTRSSTRARTRPGRPPASSTALAAADAIVIAPSNPFVSIHPILAVPGIRAALEARRVRCGRGQPADRRPRRPRARSTA